MNFHPVVVGLINWNGAKSDVSSIQQSFPYFFYISTITKIHHSVCMVFYCNFGFFNFFFQIYIQGRCANVNIDFSTPELSSEGGEACVVRVLSVPYKAGPDNADRLKF